MVINCFVCGSEDIKKIKLVINQGRRGKIEWGKCLNCNSFVSMYSYSKQKETEHTKTNTSWGKEDTGKLLNVYKTRMFNEIKQLLIKHSPPPGKIFDIGCSYGGFLIEMKKAGYDVAGYDIVPAAIKYLYEQGIEAEICYNVSESRILKKEQFNIITAIDSNCYWADHQKNIKDVYNQLPEDGLFLLRVVDKSKFLKLGFYIKKFNKYLGDKLLSYSVNDHLVSMPLPVLLKMLKETGFDICLISSKKAIHSYDTRLLVKNMFYFGDLLRKILKVNFAPGVIVIAKK